MKFSQKKLTKTLFFLLLLIFIYYHNKEVRKPTERYIQFPEKYSKFSKKCETLTWVVELGLSNGNTHSNTSEILIHEIAKSIGLVALERWAHPPPSNPPRFSPKMLTFI